MLKYSTEYNYVNVTLKEGIVFQKDYTFIYKEEGDYLYKIFGGKKIIRLKYVNKKKNEVLELYYRNYYFLALPSLSNFFIGTSKPDLQCFKFSSILPLSKLKGYLISSLNNEAINKNNSRLWATTKKEVKELYKNEKFREISYLHYDNNKSTAFAEFNCGVEFPGTCLENTLMSTISDVQKYNTFVLELCDRDKKFIFLYNKANKAIKCKNCKKAKNLIFQCNCHCVFYCSESCQEEHYQIHSKKCIDLTISNLVKANNQEMNGLVGILTSGIQNMGNTCYMNSAIQCLSNVLELTCYFLSGKFVEYISKSNSSVSKGTLSKHFCKILLDLWKNDAESIRITKFKKYFGILNVQFQGNYQQDSQEFLSLLIESLHDDLNDSINKKELFQNKENSLAKLNENRNNLDKLKEKENTILVDLFYGSTKTILECPLCNKKSYKEEIYNILLAPIPEIFHLKIFFTHQTFDVPYKINLDCYGHESVKDMLPPLFTSLKKGISYIVDNDYILVLTGSTKFNLLHWNSYIEDITNNDDYLIFVFEFRLQNKLKEFNEKICALDHNRKYSIEYSFNKYLHQESYRLLAFKILPAEETQMESFSYFKPIIFSEKCSKEHFYNEIISFYSSVLQDFIIHFYDFENRLKIRFYSQNQFCFGCGNSACKGCFFSFQGKTLFDTIQYYEKKSGIDFLSSIILLEIYFPLEIFENLSKQMNMCKSLNSKKSNNEVLHLYSCLDKLTITEVLSDENKWKCVNCTKEVNAFKKVQLFNTPKILIIAIKRFKLGDSQGEKITKLVDFPIKDLNLSLYIENKKNEEYKYNLISVIYHEGTIHSGHYYSKCYNKINKKWYLFDDHEVTPTSSEKLVNKNAYILFYEKVS